MRLQRIGFLLLIFGVITGWLTSAPSTATGQDAATIVDFESPPLGALARTIADPYQPNALVTFTSATPTNGVNVVGLVKNNATSVCIEPADANQKFGSGRSNFSDGAIGYGRGRFLPLAWDSVDQPLSEFEQARYAEMAARSAE